MLISSQQLFLSDHGNRIDRGNGKKKNKWYTRLQMSQLSHEVVRIYKEKKAVAQNLFIKEDMILISANLFTSRFQTVNPRVT
jgi:hypothetical protein